MTTDFNNIVESITKTGLDWHKDNIIKNSQTNSKFIKNTINDLHQFKGKEKAVVVSAGPSLHYTGLLNQLFESNFQGPIIAIDGSYVKCLRAGIIPDFVLTLDPHPTRLVRWFGDPNYEMNVININDDYFRRQDLDIDFRDDSLKKNNENIELVNKYATQSKLIIASTSPLNMVERSLEAAFPMYWWVPLVDNIDAEASLTRKMCEITKLPALNTGGTVGTAAWIFAKFWLEISQVSVIGMDLGYCKDLPYEMTQTYYELLKYIGEDKLIEEFFPIIKNPYTHEEFYIDPTYYWYRQNLLDILKNTSSTLFNCTEGGTLFGEGVVNMHLREFLEGT